MISGNHDGSNPSGATGFHCRLRFRPDGIFHPNQSQENEIVLQTLSVIDVRNPIQRTHGHSEDSERLRRKALIGGRNLLADRIRKRLDVAASRKPGLAVAHQDIRGAFDKGDWTGGCSTHHRHLFSF